MDSREAADPQTGAFTPLFNPRAQQWSEHFAWSSTGEQIIGRTAVGRATVEALQLNHLVLVIARRVWVAAGLHPPTEDLTHTPEGET